MADYSWGSDDMLAMAEEARQDAAQDAFHASHYGLSPLVNAEHCWDCAADVVNCPSEYLDGDSPMFWAVIDQHDLEPTTFDFVFQAQLQDLGIV